MADHDELPTEDQEPGIEDIGLEREDENLPPLQHMLSGLLLAAQEAHGEELPMEAQVAMSEFFAYGVISTVNMLMSGYHYPSGARTSVALAELRESAEEILNITDEGIEGEIDDE